MHVQTQVLEESAKRHCQGLDGGDGLFAGQQQDSRWEGAGRCPTEQKICVMPSATASCLCLLLHAAGAFTR
jgi:hypothetical protein